MFGSMMDPDMMRLAQEQMSRIPPEELAKMQQQMMKNPDLLRMATEGMKNMRPEDFRFAAEQMKNIPPEEMAKMTERMARTSPEELAAMQATNETKKMYGFQGASLLKNQGNQLHASGKFSEAAEKYEKAKENLQGVDSQEAVNLSVACSLNLMSCYLKINKFHDVIKVGTEILNFEPRSLKAFYRRGLAYKELGQFRQAVEDLRKAAEISPEDDTVAEVLRKAREELENSGEADEPVANGPIIEEITEEEALNIEGNTQNRIPSRVEQKGDFGQSSTSGYMPAMPDGQVFADTVSSLKQNPQMLRSMQSLMSNMKPEQVAALSGGGITPDMAKLAADMFKEMSPEDLEKMMNMASSFQREKASNHVPDTARHYDSTLDNIEVTQGSQGASSIGAQGAPLDQGLQEQMRKQMKDPAMKQMMSAMIKSMTPEAMASMSEQLGLKLTPEQAVEAQKAMANLSPDQLDKLMRWAERAQTVTEQAKRVKNWIMGRPGLLIAFLMLILAIILHYFGYIGR